MLLWPSLAALLFLSAQTRGANVDPCARQKFTSKCPDPLYPKSFKRSQFVLRYFRENDECVSYPYGKCDGDEIEPLLYRYLSDCEKNCMGEPVESSEAEITPSTTPAVSSSEQTTVNTQSPTTKKLKPTTIIETLPTTSTAETSQQSTNAETTNAVETTESTTKESTTAERTTEEETPSTTPLTSTPTTHQYISSTVRDILFGLTTPKKKEVEPTQSTQLSTESTSTASDETTTKAEETKCQILYSKASKSSRAVYMPRCTPESGDFADKQCFGGACWCVDVEGLQIMNTYTANGDELTCEAYDRTPKSGQNVEDAVCLLDRDDGGCGNWSEKWYFDAQVGKCNFFWYGGCAGNKNRFENREECEARCGSKISNNTTLCPLALDPVTDAAGNPFRCEDNQPCPIGAKCTYHDDFALCCPEPKGIEHQATLPGECLQKRDEGTCRDFDVRYYYDQDEDTCKYFFYGGCGGTYNNFESLQVCQKKCPSAPPPTKKPTTEEPLRKQSIVRTFRPEACLLPKDQGPCGEVFDRWFFDASAGKCSPFSYGGCLGNLNNFISEENCDSACSASLPPPPTNIPHPPVSHPTPPTLPQTTPALNWPAGESKPGVVLLGDMNPDVICRLDVSAGPCMAAFTRWYYDVKTGDCQSFIYTGCGGNQNNFASRPTCLAICSKLLPAAELPMPPPTTYIPSVKTVLVEAASPSPVGPPSPISSPSAKQCTVLSDGACRTPCVVFTGLDNCQKCVCPEAKSTVRPLEFSGEVSIPSSSTKKPMSKTTTETPLVGTDGTDATEATDMTSDSSTTTQSVETSTMKEGGKEGQPEKGTTEVPAVTQIIVTDRREICSLPPDPGPCQGAEVKYFYDWKKRVCDTFVYKGCAGNRNHFVSREECVIQCGQFFQGQPAGILPPDLVQPPVPIPFIPPPLREQLHSSFSGAAPGTQTQGSWDATGEDVEAVPLQRPVPVTPAPAEPAPTSSPDYIIQTAATPIPAAFPGAFGPNDEGVCQMPLDIGECQTTRDYVERWWFNQYTQQCVPFRFGQCGGNYNNFETRESCGARCLPGHASIHVDVPISCEPMPDPGPCDGYHPMWYFNKRNFACERFVYGGCGGNENRYKELQECQLSCPVWNKIADKAQESQAPGLHDWRQQYPSSQPQPRFEGPGPFQRPIGAEGQPPIGAEHPFQRPIGAEDPFQRPIGAQIPFQGPIGEGHRPLGSQEPFQASGVPHFGAPHGALTGQPQTFESFFDPNGPIDLSQPNRHRQPSYVQGAYSNAESKPTGVGGFNYGAIEADPYANQGGQGSSYGGSQGSSYGGSQGSSYGGSQDSYGGSQGSSYGGSQDSYGGSQDSYVGDQGGMGYGDSEGQYGSDRGTVYGGTGVYGDAGGSMDAYGAASDSGYGGGAMMDSYGSQDSYGAASQDPYGAQSQDSYGAASQDTYGAQSQDSYGGQSQDPYADMSDGYGSQDTYGGGAPMSNYGGGGSAEHYSPMNPYGTGGSVDPYAASDDGYGDTGDTGGSYGDAGGSYGDTGGSSHGDTGGSYGDTVGSYGGNTGTGYGADGDAIYIADKCSEPRTKGPCEGYYLRWYYDTSYGKCLSFVYGGCKGSKNNFESKDECEYDCGVTQEAGDSYGSKGYGSSDSGYGDNDSGYGDKEDSGYGEKQDSGYDDKQDSGYGEKQDSGYGEKQDSGYGDESGYGSSDSYPTVGSYSMSDGYPAGPSYAVDQTYKSLDIPAGKGYSRLPSHRPPAPGYKAHLHTEGHMPGEQPDPPGHKHKLPSCPSGGHAMTDYSGGMILCVPGSQECPSSASCHFNGLEFYCCPAGSYGSHNQPMYGQSPDHYQAVPYRPAGSSTGRPGYHSYPSQVYEPASSSQYGSSSHTSKSSYST